jgi:hypothetical protein
MFFHTLESSYAPALTDLSHGGRRDDVLHAPVAASLPGGIAFTERAAATLRAYLASAGLHDYRVFYCNDLDVDDVGEHLDALGEGDAAWQPLPCAVEGGAGFSAIHIVGKDVNRLEAGCLRLPSHEVVLGRWHWLNDEEVYLRSVWLCAAPSVEHVTRLRDAVRRHRHAKGGSSWRIMRSAYDGDERVPREPLADDALFLPAAIRARIDTEVVRFFSSEAAGLYASLGVPYRRGVLLHGPPGNGKTSMIRLIGSRLPSVPGILLRPAANFDADQLGGVFRRWTEEAPCILVVEDLDWLLERVDVSSFLNLIDGVDSAATGGLLLVATTNHPERLDPAVNNRPGRFDVVVEVPGPDESLRLAFLRRHLDGCDEALLRELAADGDGLAFAHLHEVIRLAGLIAINAGRTSRIDEDVRAAFRTVRESNEAALRGFPGGSSMAFGLAHLHRKPAGSH